MDRAPRIVWAWVGLQVLGLATGFVFYYRSHLALFFLTIVVEAIFLYWFMQGLRATWWIAVVVPAVWLIQRPFLAPMSASSWVAVGFSMIGLGLLLTPSMGRYFFHRDVSAQT